MRETTKPPLRYVFRPYHFFRKTYKIEKGHFLLEHFYADEGLGAVTLCLNPKTAVSKVLFFGR